MVTGSPTSLLAHPAEVEVMTLLAPVAVMSVTYRADVGSAGGVIVKTTGGHGFGVHVGSGALVTPVKPPTQPVQARFTLVVAVPQPVPGNDEMVAPSGRSPPERND